ncbi:MAG: hypothetical protein HRT66_02850 [Flavobacteriaceae bacterium]|nr:hypothetical protein [Flavobacteriaceae bacterium]
MREIRKDNEKTKEKIILIIAIALLVVILTTDLGDLVDAFNQGRNAYKHN